MIDLRSDTVTRPTPPMLEAMVNAELGDDVLGADPATAALESDVANVLGKEAAIFMPSGTMTNQVAVRLHCGPGDEFLCERDCHIYNYEQGAFAQLSGVVAHPIQGQVGVLMSSDVEHLIRPDDDHMVRTKLICIENTHNRGGGRVQPQSAVDGVCDWAHENGLRTHLDGARIFNAAVAQQVAPSTLATKFDTVSVCFSKGLGAPVGSALAGDRQLIRAARRHRKLFGGGMRQSGVIAEAARYALHHHVERLAEDHANAATLAEAIRAVDGLQLINDPVETNILYFDVAPELGTAPDFVARMEQSGVAALFDSTRRIRLVTHLDVGHDDVVVAAAAIKKVAEQCVADPTINA